MRTEHYISLDVHCAFTEMAVVTRTGRVTKRERLATAIPPLVEAITSVSHPRYVTFEEGPMADWLYRSLRGHAEEVLVCEPRRNHLIAKESDKDDPIDAEKLAQLYRGGYLKRVHHPESSGRAAFKQHVGLYHDGVRDRVRQANYIIAQFRRQGIVVKEASFATEEDRAGLLEMLRESRLLQQDVSWLWASYDAALEKEAHFRKVLIAQARGIEPIRRFEKLPGIGWIRASTFYAYLDTPWRFKKKSALWKYMGIGLERRHSGNGPVRLYVAKRANRHLKAMILGAARKAIDHENNPFARQHERWINEGGLSVPNARRNVARSLAATLWGMWKNSSEYQPDWVGMRSASERSP